VTVRSELVAGIRAGLPIALPTLVLGASFGVLAKPVLGPVAPVVMSASVVSGGAQFAALGVLSAGGTAAAALGAGLLMNTRWVPMSFAIAPSLPGSTLGRVLQAQAIVDASFALASRGNGRFDHGLLVGATLAQATAWISGTLLGVTVAGILPPPTLLGLDAVFPAFYLALLTRHPCRPGRLPVIVAAAAIALGLLPITPPGIPVIAAAAAALLGLTYSRS
jgi:predicted branched-subunit amino acid permease